MRLYLDTNILAFILCDRDRLKKNVLDMFLDYSNSLYTSVLCVQELIHLFQIGKISAKKSTGKYLKAEEIISVFDEMSMPFCHLLETIGTLLTDLLLLRQYQIRPIL